MPTTFETPLGYQRALMLLKVESTYNVDPVPVVGSDAFLVADPDIKVNPSILEREFSANSLSPRGIVVARKIQTITFSHEIKGSGANQTASKLGTLLKPCGLAELQVANSASATIQTPTLVGTTTATGVSFAKTAAAQANSTGRYRLTCVLGGASATAKFRVSGSPACGDDTMLISETYSGSTESTTGGATGCTVTQGLTAANDYTSITYTVGNTSATGDRIVAVVGGVRFQYDTTGSGQTAISMATGLVAAINADPGGRFTAANGGGTLAVVTVTFPANVVGTRVTAGVAVTTAVTAVLVGSSGASITPTFSGSFTALDAYDVQLLEPGYHYTPISTGFQSATIYLFYDGMFHVATGCFGDVSFDIKAGGYGTAQFTYTGQYVAPKDRALPATGVVYESSEPVQIELARLQLGGSNDFCAEAVSINMQVQVQARDCMNNTDGFNGVTITGRSPQGSFNPEARLESKFDTFAKAAAGTKMSFGVRVGTSGNTAGNGNTVWFQGDAVQIQPPGYTNRNTVRAYDIPIRFNAWDSTGDNELRITII